jgi:hypothetical protein
LLELAAGLALALAPLPAVSVQRFRVTLEELATRTAMLDRPLPDVSWPLAPADSNAMSSMSTAPVTPLMVSAGLPASDAFEVTVALPPV